MSGGQLSVPQLGERDTCIPRQVSHILFQTSRYTASVNFQRHINVHLHNALIVQKPLDKSGKVAEGPMKVRREQSKIPKFKSTNEPGQSLTGAGGGEGTGYRGDPRVSSVPTRIDRLTDYLNTTLVRQGELFKSRILQKVKWK